MDSNPIYDYNNNDENRSQSSLGFISDSDEFTGVVQVVIWENGKTAKNTFTIEITSTINSVRRLKETIAYSKELSRSSIDKMKVYNHRGIEVDDIDISDLKNDDILYLDLNGDDFSVNNYINEYEFVKFVKEGGFSEVYIAKHVLRGNLVAIKKTKIANLDADSLYNISRESMYLSTLKHKNIIKIYSSYLTNNALFIVMEYAKGGELFTILDKPLSEDKAKKVFKQIHKAVKFCHSYNVIHRDLKPNNILFLDEEKTHVVLIDFGISGLSNGNNKESTKAGTYKFLPPEIIRDMNYKATTKIDIWALGVILYLMVIGKCPFEGKTRSEIFDKIVHEEVTFPAGTKISKTLYALIQGLLKKHPNERIDSLSFWFDKWYKDESGELMDIEKEEKEKNKKMMRFRERTTTLKEDSAKYFNSKLSLAIPKARTHNSSSIKSRSSTRQRTIQMTGPNYLKTTVATTNRNNRRSLFIK